MLAAAGQPRPAYRRLYERLDRLGPAELERRHELAMEMFRNHGITFAVYPDAQGNEKVFPFDIIPRVISARAWKRLEAGLKPRPARRNPVPGEADGRQPLLRPKGRPPGIRGRSPRKPREIDGPPGAPRRHSPCAGTHP